MGREKKKIDSEVLEDIIKRNLYEIGNTARNEFINNENDDGNENKAYYNPKEKLEHVKILEQVKEKIEFYENKKTKENIKLNYKTFIPKFAMLEYSFNKSLYKVIPSPRGLGKTYNSAKVWLKYLIEEHDNDMTWFRYKEKHTNELVKVFEDIIREENLSSYCEIKENQKSGFTEIVSKVTNSILDFRGAFSFEQLKGVYGKNKFLFDEATQFPIDSIFQLIGSVRNRPREEHWFLFNLGTSDKYIQTNPEDFVRKMKEEKAFILELTQKDNIYIDENYLKKLEGFKTFSESSYYEATGKRVEKKKEKEEEFNGITVIESEISPRIKELFPSITKYY